MEKQVKVAVSHVEDDVVYVFAIGPVHHEFIPDTPFDMDDSDCIFISENEKFIPVWSFQSEFYTKDEFRDKYPDKKVKRVYLDDEVRIVIAPVSVRVSDIVNRMIDRVGVVTLNLICAELGVTAQEFAQKYFFGMDGVLYEKDTNNPVELTQTTQARLHAFEELVKQLQEVVFEVNHDAKNQSKKAQSSTQRTSTEKIPADVTDGWHQKGDVMPENTPEDSNG